MAMVMYQLTDEGQALLDAPQGDQRELLLRRARMLARLGVGWHGIEAAIAVGAGVAAGSIALVGFGADSLVEAVAGLIVLWRFASARVASAVAERRAQQLIALCFYLIAAYVGVEAVRSLATATEPSASWVGIGLAAFTLVAMPPLAAAKARVADALWDQDQDAGDSSATRYFSFSLSFCK